MGDVDVDVDVDVGEGEGVDGVVVVVIWMCSSTRFSKNALVQLVSPDFLKNSALEVNF